VVRLPDNNVRSAIDVNIPDSSDGFFLWSYVLCYFDKVNATADKSNVTLDAAF